jgi:phosphatidylserine/phosphatidylglycerophosphate/cardiolipin synthase-like enzyme
MSEPTVPLPLLEATSRAGRALQPAHSRKLAQLLAKQSGPGGQAALLAVVPSEGYRAAVGPLLEEWGKWPDVTGGLLGAAVAAASLAHEDARSSPSVELVVSGPSTPLLHARRTEQVLRQLIGEATHELLLMTYNLSMYAELRDALSQAIAEGVNITVLAEDPGNKAQLPDPAVALAGLKVTLLRWPSDKRDSLWASMHAKVVVVDRVAALITSANLSEVAANDSIEAGVLLRGGDLPGRLVDHVARLKAEGILLAG